MWPYQSGNAALWQNDDNYKMPAIAVVDSGIASRAGFGNRVIASVNLSSLPNNSPGDGRGHGTFVAGIAADAAANHAGAAPVANLVSVDVMDDTGTGSTSDIIAACQWILDHKAQYNIKVANFSLHSSIVAPFYYDPLDRAVEKLWFNGITVVTAAGNYGHAEWTQRRQVQPGQRPVRRHRRRCRHQRHHHDERRHDRALVGMGPHDGRLLEARALGPRPLHGRSGSGKRLTRYPAS